ncbi:MAG: NADH-quinone oxidoreductase subunit M [Anaerolineae bacterium]|nr:NADH-quinone oxidoreductase subunit M [Anaerolineae bacterium]
MTLFSTDNLLTLITFTPLAGAVLLLILSENKYLARWIALLVSLIPLGVSIWLWFAYQQNPCVDLTAGACFEQQVAWFPLLNSSYHVGVDGISLTMVLLTTLLTPLAILISWTIEERVNLYMALFLLLEMGMLGVFVSLDLLLFFVFWEFGLVPMYFLINLWGSDNRRYASRKFFLYTMAGSLGLLLSIQIIGLTVGSFDLIAIMEKWPAIAADLPVFAGVSMRVVRGIAFWAFVIAFAIKVPVWPFHTWLPDAHTEAPTAGSMILAGVLLKLGAYGFIRLVLPLFPLEARYFSPVLAIFAMLAIVLGAFAAFGQRDFKRLVAYSSVNHMGFVVLGIAAAAFVGPAGRYDPNGINQLNATIALNGAVLQMFNHGISAAAMFALVGVIYDRLHTRDLNQMGGLWVAAPIYGGIMIFSSMASLGLPGLNGFVGEFMVVRGVWPVNPVFTLMVAISMLGLLFTGAYVLKAIRQVLHGPLNQAAVDKAHGRSIEINAREVIALAPLLVLMLVIGVFPAWIVGVINATVSSLLF